MRLPTPTEALVGLALTLGLAAASIAVVLLVVLRLPPDAFTDPRRRHRAPAHPAWRVLWLVGKNLGGVALVALGLFLSIPGVPGQGLLTILLGLMLVDFPGKYRLERALIRRPTIHGPLNRWRVSRGKPPLDLPDAEP